MFASGKMLNMGGSLEKKNTQKKNKTKKNPESMKGNKRQPRKNIGNPKICIQC